MKQSETPEWEKARQALAKMNPQISKSPVKSSTKASNSNPSGMTSTIQQQPMMYQQYYQQYYPPWNGYNYQYPYTGYMPPYPMPPSQPNVLPPPVSVFVHVCLSFAVVTKVIKGFFIYLTSQIWT